MRATIWGCRGSLAAPGPETVRYGGNTSCVDVRLAGGEVLVLDAGTGMRALGQRLDRDDVQVVHVLLSHLHLDHLQGLAFFSPIWRNDVELHIWGPRTPLRSLEECVATYMSPPLFPVHLSDVAARCIFHDAEGEWAVGDATVYASPVAHAGPTVGYRIEEAGKTLTYLPDHEPVRITDIRTVAPEWISGHDLAHGADVLLHDSQYTEDEYPRHVGWGHSSIDQVVTFAQTTHVRQLVLFHHDPLHADEDVDAKLKRACELWGDEGLMPIAAHEGMTLEL